MSNVEFTCTASEEKSKSNSNSEFVVVEPVLLDVSEAERIRTYINGWNRKLLYNSLGPNWEFHLEQEIVERMPIGFFDRFIEPGERAKAIAELGCNPGTILDIVNGNGIKNKGTLQALYNWKPECLVRDLLIKNPDWERVVVNRNGIDVVVRVCDPVWNSKGMDIPHHPVEMRRQLWKKAADKTRDTWTNCLNCILDSPPPSPPKLVRQHAEHFYCSESLPCKCVSCNEVFIARFSF